MLQLIQTIHSYCVVNHPLYFSVLVLIASVLMPGYYKLGKMQAAAAYMSPAPQSAPVRPRYVFYRRGYAVVLQVAHLLILANVESNNNTIAATIALKVT